MLYIKDKIVRWETAAMELTKSELEVMNVLWKAKEPLSRNDIIELSENKSWKDSSIHILLNGLLKKEAIYEAGFRKSGKTYGRLFAANISGEEYYAKAVFSAGGEENLPMLFSALVHSNYMTPEAIDELEELLEKRKKELKAEQK